MSWLVHTKQLTEDQSNILTYIQRGYKHKQTKETNKMIVQKEDIKRLEISEYSIKLFCWKKQEKKAKKYIAKYNDLIKKLTKEGNKQND
jgi:hypothetical protein